MLNNRKYIKYIFNVKGAFTLLEIIIVIIIIGILIAATMRFWGGRVSFLNNKNVKEQFISSYDQLYSDNVLSSYYMWEIYTNLNINFESWLSWFDYVYVDRDWNEIFSDFAGIEVGNYVINKIEINWIKKDEISLEFTPYVLWCSVGGQIDDSVNIEIIVNHDKAYCFEISPDSCRIEKISCD